MAWVPASSQDPSHSSFWCLPGKQDPPAAGWSAPGCAVGPAASPAPHSLWEPTALLSIHVTGSRRELLSFSALARSTPVFQTFPSSSLPLASPTWACSRGFPAPGPLLCMAPLCRPWGNLGPPQELTFSTCRPEHVPRLDPLQAAGERGPAPRPRPPPHLICCSLPARGPFPPPLSSVCPFNSELPSRHSPPGRLAVYEA